MSLSLQLAPQQPRRDAREQDAPAGTIARLAEGALYALQHTFALDGRVRSYPSQNHRLGQGP
jgi:hypothetical protein